jgi:hypothetical protein
MFESTSETHKLEKIKVNDEECTGNVFLGFKIEQNESLDYFFYCNRYGMSNVIRKFKDGWLLTDQGNIDIIDINIVFLSTNSQYDKCVMFKTKK